MSLQRGKTRRKDRPDSRSLEKRVKDYSVAAVGIGAVAFAPAANAAIVTLTVAPTISLNGGTTPINISGHNVVSLSNSSTDGSFFVFATAVAGGMGFGVPGPQPTRNLLPIPFNQVIPGGTLAHFTNSRTLVSSSSDVSVFTGFLGTKYLGFSFLIGGQTHYGWVQLTITQPGGGGHPYVVTVNNAAYESIAGQSIRAGQLVEPAAPNTTPAPNTMWLLAMGAAGLAGIEAIRRRRKAA